MAKYGGDDLGVVKRECNECLPEFEALDGKFCVGGCNLPIVEDLLVGKSVVGDVAVGVGGGVVGFSSHCVAGELGDCVVKFGEGGGGDDLGYEASKGGTLDPAGKEVASGVPWYPSGVPKVS